MLDCKAIPLFSFPGDISSINYLFPPAPKLVIKIREVNRNITKKVRHKPNFLIMRENKLKAEYMRIELI